MINAVNLIIGAVSLFRPWLKYLFAAHWLGSVRDIDQRFEFFEQEGAARRACTLV